MMGIILAGGRSARLGRDKATAHVLGKPLVQWVYEALRDAGATSVVVVAQPGQRLPGLSLEVRRLNDDRAAGADGPLVALERGLRYASDAGEQVVVVAPCDVPALAAEDVRLAVSCLARDGGDAVFLSSGPKGPHPLLAAYHVAAAHESAMRCVARGDRAARAILPSLRGGVLERSALRRPAATDACNTAEEVGQMADLLHATKDATVRGMAPTLVALILAAGKGTRMRSELPKVLHRLAGRPLLHHVLDAASHAGAGRAVVVIGYQSGQVRESVERAGYDRADFAVQAEQRGTGHAVQCALPAVRSDEKIALILSGDVPGIRGDQLKALVELLNEESSLALMTFEAEDPTGYGRIVRGAGGEVTAIREHKDANPAERHIRECNAGIYAVRVGLLTTALPTLSDRNAAGEVYLTDLVEVAASSGAVRALRVAESEVAGVNTPEQLAAMERELSARG